MQNYELAAHREMLAKEDKAAQQVAEMRVLMAALERRAMEAEARASSRASLRDDRSDVASVVSASSGFFNFNGKLDRLGNPAPLKRTTLLLRNPSN